MIEIAVLYLWARIFMWMVIAILCMLGLAVVCACMLSSQISREEEAAASRKEDRTA